MSLRCECIEGFLTHDQHHESWCPAITGDYDGLPIVRLTSWEETATIDPTDKEEES